MVGCPCVRLSVPYIESTAAVTCGGFVARYRRVQHGAQQHGKCEQCHVYSRRRKLNIDLLLILFQVERFERKWEFLIISLSFVNVSVFKASLPVSANEYCVLRTVVSLYVSVN